MIWVTGDVHGAERIGKRLNTRNFPQQKQMTKEDFVIVAGDFELIWNLDAEDRFWLKRNGTAARCGGCFLKRSG